MVKNKVFIIAEAGCNHNGELKLAKKLIDIAKRAKADAVKFQSFKVEELAVKNAPKANYAISNTKFYKTQYEMQSKLQLSFNDQLKLLKYCKKKRIKFLSSSFDVQSTEDLKKMNLDIIKIPSGEITNLPNLIKIGSLKKKIILSTGMSTIREIKQAIKILNQKGTNQKDITLLHCTTFHHDGTTFGQHSQLLTIFHHIFTTLRSPPLQARPRSTIGPIALMTFPIWSRIF